ncbi:MAG: nucleotidyltransferase [Sedimentisphaerales bacterium]
MAIPESQLETWSHQGSVAQSKNTYASIRNALLDSKAAYANQSFEVFLQGSYGNDTNIFAESDMDIVICLNSIMRGDVSNLPSEQQAAFHKAHPKATYTFSEFKQGVVARLLKAFGTDTTSGNKAIKVKANGTRRSADVVTCFQYRRYTRFFSVHDQKHFPPGIIFPSLSGGEIINYPKQHSENCTIKHQATNNCFKPMVRIVKNMRSKLVEDGVITNNTAPSYYIEGLLYNVPNDKFDSSYGDTFCNCFNWILKTDKSKLICANERYFLIGNSNVQWLSSQCDHFLDALVNLWNNW